MAWLERQSGRFPQKLVQPLLNLIRHLTDGLSVLHDRGVVHRDLKPENVFLSDDGALKLGDFGLVRRDDGAELTTAGQTVGSVRYMAPEQVRGRSDIDGRCDLYALGCLLFELLTGRPPFPSMEPMVVFQQHVDRLAGEFLPVERPLRLRLAQHRFRNVNAA